MERNFLNLKKTNNLKNFLDLFKHIKGKDLLINIYPDLKNKTSLQRKKGDLGIIGVIGGSVEYTGAPYYSGLSAIKAGSDLSHIFCHREAAIPIKSYSPELIVHPAFDDNINQELLNKCIRWLKSMDVLVYGCGMGRDYPTEIVFEQLISESSKLKGKFPLRYFYS
jgi:NAD(P)H-hydrate repair Nnr-like enzyme with NAD(P)H-hydrate dehydratase domain